MKEFTHFDRYGNARMVDISEKGITSRTAKAVGRICMSKECLCAVAGGNVRKGDVFAIAQIAGIMGVKKTSDMIPLCHRLNLTHCKVEFQVFPEENEIEVSCIVGCDGMTGVEMEALTGVSVALLTIYDMCKAIDRSMTIKGIHLLEKTGGKSGEYYYNQAGDK